MNRVLLVACVCAVAAWTGCQGGPSGSAPASYSSSARDTGARPAQKSVREMPTPVPVSVPVKPAKPLPKFTPLMETVEADRLYLAGDYVKAYDLYCKAVRARGSELDAHDGLSRCVAELKRYNEGCAFYEKLLKTNSQDPFILYGAARMYLTVGDRQLASGTAYRSIRFNSNLSRSFYLIALMQSTDSEPRLKSAERAFEQALEREPDYGPAYYQLALLNASSGNRPRAKAMAARAMETLKPVERDTRSETRLLLGALCAADQDYGRALEVFREGLQEEGPSFYEKADVGLLLQRMNRPDEARKEWDKVVEAFGLGHPTGLAAYRETFKFQAGNVDHSAFLPRSASDADYRDLVFYLGQPGSVKPVAVPKELQGVLDEYRTPVFYKKVDLDGDGKEESIVVDARPTLNVGTQWKGQNLPRLEKHWRLANPNLYVFNSSGGLVGTYASHMDHLYSVDTVDFNNDGTREIVLTEFGGGNVLNLVVLAKRNVQYQPVLVCPVECSQESCGVLIADLDGDGRRELMTASGGPAWVDVYRFGKEGTFTACQKDFPRFYRDYLARYSKLSPDVLSANPDLREHLDRARLIVGNTGNVPASATVVKASGANRQ